MGELATKWLHKHPLHVKKSKTLRHSVNCCSWNQWRTSYKVSFKHPFQWRPAEKSSFHIHCCSYLWSGRVRSSGLPLNSVEADEELSLPSNVMCRHRFSWDRWKNYHSTGHCYRDWWSSRVQSSGITISDSWVRRRTHHSKWQHYLCHKFFLTI